MQAGSEPKVGVVLNLQRKATSMPDTLSTIENKGESVKYIIHFVSLGETLYSISQKYNTPLEDIKSKNGLVSDQISLGMELKIEKPKNSAIIVYKVQIGDTLYSISRKFSVTVDEIKFWNNISDNSIIIGQNIEIRTR
jgi:LysM repeat protein